MKLLIFFTASLLAGLAYSAPTPDETGTEIVAPTSDNNVPKGPAPTSDNTVTKVAASNDDILTITEEFFPESLAVYTSEHDVVKILTPLNALNFDEDEDDDDSGSESDSVTFIVLADVQENGDKVDQGLYLLKNKHATKLLDNGRDAAAANDDTKTAYFAAKDGIYSYNAAENKAEKYGTVTDDLISIAKVNGSDIIYALTADNVLLKVTEEGKKREVVDKVVKAKEIILDYQNNLYYYTNENIVYVLAGDEVKKIEGLPANPSYVNIINPPFVIENGVPVIVDNRTYMAYENGTSEAGEIELAVRPTAYSMEATLIHYYGYNKKVYEYNILEIILGDVLTDLKSFLDEKTDSIQSIATRSRDTLRA